MSTFLCKTRITEYADPLSQRNHQAAGCKTLFFAPGSLYFNHHGCNKAGYSLSRIFLAAKERAS